MTKVDHKLCTVYFNFYCFHRCKMNALRLKRFSSFGGKVERKARRPSRSQYIIINRNIPDLKSVNFELIWSVRC